MQAIVRAAAARSRPLQGVACEKPLARTLKEAREMLRLAEDAGLSHGYLGNQVHAPAIQRGKDITWRRAVPAAERPYLARAAEEHSAPHRAWFWQGTQQGGGVLLDMIYQRTGQDMIDVQVVCRESNAVVGVALSGTSDVATADTAVHAASVMIQRVQNGRNQNH